jgi:hypothetical protein
MKLEFDRAEATRKSRRSPAKSLISLDRGSRAEVRKSLVKSLILLKRRAAAELPPNTPLRACARVRAARMRVQGFVR